MDEAQQSAASSAQLQQALQAAAELSDEGRWAEAFELLLGEQAAAPDDPVLLCMLGVTASEVDAAGLAYDFFRRCLAQDPQDPHVLVAAGAGLARFDDVEAERALRLAALTAPTLFVTRLSYGSYLTREGQLELALRELQAARDLDPDDARAHRELGVLHLLRGEGELAVAALEEAAGRSVEDDAEIRVILGLALLQRGRAEAAAEELHRAAAELEADGEAQLLTALACASQDWADEAWNALARAEQAAFAPDAGLLREAEDAIEAGARASARLLREHVAPALLRERLFGPTA